MADVATPGSGRSERRGGARRRPLVVAVAVVPARRTPVVALLNRVVAAGGSAVLVTADGTAPDAHPGIETIDLARTERRVGVNAVTGLAAPVWRSWRASPPYRAVRPWMLWRALRRHLDRLDVAAVDHVVIVALESWPITWQLCRRGSGTTYGWDVPGEVFERFGRAAPERIEA